MSFDYSQITDPEVRQKLMEAAQNIQHKKLKLGQCLFEARKDLGNDEFITLVERIGIFTPEEASRLIDDYQHSN